MILDPLCVLPWTMPCMLLWMFWMLSSVTCHVFVIMHLWVLILIIVITCYLNLWVLLIFQITNSSRKRLRSFKRIWASYFVKTSHLQEKGMGFLFLSTYFMFWVLFTWIYELLIWYGIFVVSVMGWMNVYLCLDFWVMLIRFLGFYFCFHAWYWLSMSFDLFDVWISYPLCYDIFLFTVMHFVCVFDWFKMVVFRRLSYLFIMCVASVFWILSTLCWLDRFILFMPYLIVICPLLVKCVLH